MMEQTNWIWTRDWGAEDDRTPRIVLFRKAFRLAEIPSSLKVRVSADTRYKLYVNGKFVQFGPSKGDARIWFADTVDIAPFLKPGENVIGAAVLRYPLAREAGCHSMFRTGTPGLYVKGCDDSIPSDHSVPGGSAAAVCISADDSWRCRTVRSVSFVREEKDFAPLIIHEEAAGDPESAGWTESGYDDGAWTFAVPYLKPEMPETISPGNLQERTIPFLYRKKRRFAGVLQTEGNGIGQAKSASGWQALLQDGIPLTVPAGSRVSAVLDAGEEMTGFLHLAMTGGRGAKITLLESEAYVLDEKSPTSGTAIKKDRRDFVSGHLEGYQDVYRAAGYGRTSGKADDAGPFEKTGPAGCGGRPEAAGDGVSAEVFEPFWFRTFRFIEVTIETEEEDLTIPEISYEETGYPLEVRTKVETSDASFDSIWDISERTLRRCMHETYEDCPFYEQLQYVMDTRSQILYTYSVSADDRLARKAIDDFARAQRSDGLLNCSYPNMNPNVIPGFSIYYILMVHDHMMYFGDRKLVRRYLPVIDGILNFFDRSLTGDGLVGKVGGENLKAPFWSFIDWTPEWNPTTGMPPAGLYGPVTMESLLYLYGLQKAADLCSCVGRNDTASEYLARAQELKAAIRRCCMNAEGLITDGPGDAADCVCEAGAGGSPQGNPATGGFQGISGTGGSPCGSGKEGAACLQQEAQCAVSQHCQVFGLLTGVLDREEGRRNLLRTLEEPGHAQCTVAMCFYLFRALEQTDLYAYTDRFWDIWRKMVSWNCTTTVESEDYARSECHAWGALALYELPSAILGVRPAAPGYEKLEVRPHTEFLDFAEGTVHTPKGDVSVSWRKQNGEVKVWTRTDSENWELHPERR